MSRWAVLSLAGAFLVSCAVPHSSKRPGLSPSRRPYSVNGERYEPLQTHEGFTEEGLASWYGSEWNGKRTSSGEPYDMDLLTAAHKTLPLGVYVKVRARHTGRETVVRINDRGPFVRDRIIDLSRAAARELGFEDAGIIPVRIEALGYRDAGPGGVPRYTPLPDYGAGTFAVQVASFAVSGNAVRLATEMKATHGAAAVQEAVVQGSRFYRVRVGHYATLREADEACRAFARSGYPGSFVVAIDESR